MMSVYMYFRIHSALNELLYTKGKVHKNSICHMQARKRKFNGYMSCTFPYLAVLNIVPVGCKGTHALFITGTQDDDGAYCQNK